MKGWINRLLQDSLVYGLGYGLSRFLQIIILPIIAQALTLSEYGYYSNYVIFYTLFGGLLVLGLDSAVARYFYDSQDKKYHQQLFSSAFLFILLLSFVTIGTLWLFPDQLLRFMGVPSTYRSALPYLYLSIPAATTNSFLLSWFKWKREKIKFLINSGGTVVFLLIPLLIAEEITFLYIFQAIFWSQLIVAILSVVLASGYLRPMIHRSLLVTLLKYGFPWMLVFIFGVSRTYLDRAFLIRYLNDDNYGLYNFSIRIASLLSVILTAFDMSFGPLAFSIWDKENAREFFARLQSLYVLLIGFVACAISVCSTLIIKIPGGDKFAGAEKILPLLLFAAILLSLINFSNLGTTYAKKSVLSTVCLFIGFVTVLALNFFLTPMYFQFGATTASLIGHLAIIVAGYYLSARFYLIPFSYRKDALVFFSFLGLSFFSVSMRLFDGMYLNISAHLAILMLVTFLLLFFFFGEEVKSLRTLLAKFRAPKPVSVHQ